MFSKINPTIQTIRIRINFLGIEDLTDVNSEHFRIISRPKGIYTAVIFFHKKSK